LSILRFGCEGTMSFITCTGCHVKLQVPAAPPGAALRCPKCAAITPPATPPAASPGGAESPRPAVPVVDAQLAEESGPATPPGQEALPPEMLAQVQAQLGPDEKVVWVGRPDAQIVFKRALMQGLPPALIALLPTIFFVIVALVLRPRGIWVFLLPFV